jgi:hypothetical protein
MYLWILSILSIVGAQPYMQEAIRVSQASYCDQVHDWTCSTCDNDATLTNVIENNGERAIVGAYTTNDFLFVAFRGSTNIENWIDNVQFSFTCPYESPNLCVETGFYKVYSSMQEAVTQSLLHLVQYYGIKNVVVTGHSLGAAIATLMAYDLYISNTFDKISLITFGSPRVGNEAFVSDIVNKSISSLRITHAYDIVPHVPQEFLKYLHIPHEIWYPEDTNDVVIECNDENMKEDPRCSDSCGPLHCTSVQDHLNYLNVSMGTTGDC